LAARFPLAGSLVALLVACTPASPPAPPDVVIVTLDTTRVDHLSTYGYPRTTSPSLDRLASEAVTYSRAWSTSSWTLPAHASLFTGLYPSTHGAHFDLAGKVGLGELRAGILDERFVTLAERLAVWGYATAGFTSGPWLLPSLGLLQGFEHIDAELTSVQGREADEVTDAAIAWLATADPNEPLFLFVNYFDPHEPYDPPQGFDDLGHARDEFSRKAWWVEAMAGREPLTPAERQILIDRYDGEIRAMDHQLGRLIEALNRRRGGERSLIVVTADHGESFGEGGHWVHNTCLCEEQVRIPLVIRYPDRRGAGSVDDAPIQLVDIVPIVAQATGLELPEGHHGVLPGDRKRAYLELHPSGANIALYGEGQRRTLGGVIEWPYKLLVSDRGEREWLLLDGIEERSAGTENEKARELAEALDAHRRRVGSAEVQHPVVDDSIRDSLRALGYLEE
jgi:arylsulfatase A-like enzyme